MTDLSRIKQLETSIDNWDNEYWINNNEAVPDSVYETAIRELRLLDPMNPRLTKVQSLLIFKGKKVKHDTPMLSLDKTYTVEETLAWCTKVKREGIDELFQIQPKLDGIAARYDGKILSTRGDDGITGEDITDKLPIIMCETIDVNGHPLDIPLSMVTVPLLGEILMRKSVFDANKHKILRKDKSNYKYPRSACVGLISQDDTNPNIGMILSFVDYRRFSMTHPFSIIKDMAWEMLIDDYQTFDYPTDGLVIKLNDFEYSHSLGYTSHHPRGQIAMKYGNPSEKTILLEIEWKVGKDGQVVPIGIVDPVKLSDAEITRASLHNAKTIIDKDINLYDDCVIEKAGDIIPQIVSTTHTSESIPIVIDNCPSCGSVLGYSEPHLYCSNINCPGRNLKVLCDAISRIGIEHIGEPTIENMMLHLNVSNLIDVFKLTKDQIESLPRFAVKSSDKLYSEIDRVRINPMEDWKLLSSFNIRGVGKVLSKKILTEVNLSELFQMYQQQTLSTLPNIGPERAIEISEYFDSNIGYISELYSLLNIVTTKKDIKFESKGTICFTGKSVIARDTWKEQAEKYGFTVTNSVSSKLDYLITHDLNDHRSKMTKARSYNVKIITYDDFAIMIRP